MNVRPLYDRVLVKRSDEPTRSSGGLYIPESAKEKPMQGEVIAVGNGHLSDDGSLSPLQVQVGDKVVFGKYSGTEIKVAGEDRIILREEEILGILD